MPDLLTIQISYWGVMMGLIAVSIILRRLTAVRALRRHGAGLLTGVFTVRVYAEMRAYRKLCERQGESLVWWRVWWGLHIATAVMMVGWVVLIAVAN